jgi:hypothetical protein
MNVIEVVDVPRGASEEEHVAYLTGHAKLTALCLSRCCHWGTEMHALFTG